MKEVEGFILSETPYGETSKIINILTKNEVIGCIAKGAKSLKSNLRSGTIKFTYGKFLINYKENKLSNLIDVKIVDELKNIKTDIYLISYLSYIVELTNQIVKQNEDIDKIYELFISIIKKLNEKLNPLILTNIYELKILDYLGVGINFETCSICNNKTNIITIDGDVGGYICKNCYTNQMIYDQKTLKLLRLYYYIDINSINKLNIDKSTIVNIDKFITTYYERYTGIYIHTKQFIKKLDEL